MNPCGRFSVTETAHSIVIGDLLFSLASIIVHILEVSQKPEGLRCRDNNGTFALLGFQYDYNYMESATQVLCWIYLVIHVINILLAILLWQTITKSDILKCMSYLAISPLVIIIGLSTFLFHAIVMGTSVHFYALGMYPIFWLYKIYCLWVVKEFLTELRLSPGEKRRKDYMVLDNSNQNAGLDGYQNFKEYYEKDELELKLPKKFEIPEDNLVLDHKTCLEYEELNSVIRGVLEIEKENFTEVAVKTLKVTTPTIPFSNRLLQEAKLLAHIGSHDHILKFYGVCTKAKLKDKLFLVIEYYPRGKLDAFLKDCIDSYGGKTFTNLLDKDGRIELPRDRRIYENLIITKMEFNTMDMLQWAFQIASAMEHLHKKRVVYGCLQRKSVVLITTQLVKLTGFTFAAKLQKDNKLVRRDELPSRFPWRWTALECIEGSDDSIRFTTRSDIWSYAVLLWEIFSLGEVPYGAWDTDIVKNLMNGSRLEKPKYTPPQIYEIMDACWRKDPIDRPNFSLLKLFFKQLLSSPLSMYSGKSFPRR